MKVYDLKGVVLGKKAVIGVVLPEKMTNNDYKIFKIYNISGEGRNKIVIHFKDLKGDELKIDTNKPNLELFVIDLTKNVTKIGTAEIDFTKKIEAAFHHQNHELTKTPKEIFDAAFDPIVTPDTTGKGTIREGEEDGK